MSDKKTGSVLLKKQVTPKGYRAVRGFLLMYSDSEYMARALCLAEQGRGWVSPNPMVGCLIVKHGVVIGEGWHERAGGPHAEVVAYANCRAADTSGATVYITLEPCTHFGKTPPCVDLLLERHPSRVVIAMPDPNPMAAGGAMRLQSAGISVALGVLENEARRLNEMYIKYITTGRPWVTAKCAMTLDGKIATRTGHSKWVTGEAARQFTHRLRHAHDAILVGSRTVMIDNPSLTTRLPEGNGRNPIRILLDAGDYLTQELNVFRNDRESPTWVVTAGERSYPFADETLVLPPGPGGVDMAVLMEVLSQRGIASVLIEGGGATLAAAFEAGIVDKCCFFGAPKIVGGVDAITPVEGRGCALMDEALQLVDLKATQVGEDVLLEAYVRRQEVKK